MLLKILLIVVILLPVMVYSTDPAGLPVPPQGFSSKKSSIPHGTLSGVLNYPTRDYGQKPMKVYTPPGYSATSETKYPVMYLHHGIGGNESAWTSSACGQRSISGLPPGTYYAAFRGKAGLSPVRLTVTQ